MKDENQYCVIRAGPLGALIIIVWAFILSWGLWLADRNEPLFHENGRAEITQGGNAACVTTGSGKAHCAYLPESAARNGKR